MKGRGRVFVAVVTAGGVHCPRDFAALREQQMADLSNYRIAVLVTDGVEESELTEPVLALRDVGARVDVIAPHDGHVQAMRHHDKSITIAVDRTLDEARADEYDAVLLPGGALNADALRVEARAQQFVQAMNRDDKPMSVICHAPWLLVSADLVDGRTLTSYHTIRDDIENAGGNWVDQEVVVDGNLVTSRRPRDIPAFNRETLALLERAGRHATA